jgi:hypothetical protein
MARPQVTRAAENDGIGLSPVAVKVCLGLAVLGAAATLVWWINRINDRVQAERRVLTNPALASWFESARREIAVFERQSALAAPARGERLVEAVWTGTVSKRELNHPVNRRPELIGVTLSPAHLLAGRRSPKDERNDTVRISVKDFRFATGEPQTGERWVFSVDRINGGFNVVRDARPVP